MILFNVYFNPFLAVILRFFHVHHCFPVVLAQCGVSTAGCRQRCLLPLFLHLLWSLSYAYSEFSLLLTNNILLHYCHALLWREPRF